MQPVHSEPAYKLAASMMRDRILNGEIAVGATLPSELALAELLGVNRSTVREAIRLLEENGIVSRKPGGKKLFVSVPKTQVVAAPITGAMILQKITFNELYRTMHTIEPVVAADATQNATEDQIALLRENMDRTEALAPDHVDLSRLDIDFHNILTEACGNRAMQLCRQPIVALFYPAFDAVMKRLNAGERMVEAHRQIMQAVAERDAETAQEWMRRHIEDFKRGYELANLDIDEPIQNLPQKRDSIQ
ncbi:hypothetical protein RA28_10020 [Ruegeria sp. ANG-S4]|nr:hypothetical protein RA28_10020 [Ruegeria sp. ANG-S4]